MTHRLQVRVDRQITPRPGRNITRKWVYERSFSVHLLPQDSLNSHWAFSQLLFQVWLFVSITGPTMEHSQCASTWFDIWRLCCLDCNTGVFTGLSCQHRITFIELRVAYFLDCFRALSKVMAQYCNVLWMCYCYWMCVELNDATCLICGSWLKKKRRFIYLFFSYLTLGCIDTCSPSLCRSTESTTSGLHESLGGVLQETRLVLGLCQDHTEFIENFTPCSKVHISILIYPLLLQMHITYSFSVFVA